MFQLRSVRSGWSGPSFSYSKNFAPQNKFALKGELYLETEMANKSFITYIVAHQNNSPPRRLSFGLANLCLPSATHAHARGGVSINHAAVPPMSSAAIVDV